MSKPKPIQINIPNPCTQNWDEMTPAAQGRFCGQCQKTVINFTLWSDAALYNFFSKNTGHICGRYLATQLSRPINIPYQPHSRLYRLTIALGLSLAFVPTPHLLAQNRPPLVTQTDTSQKKKPTENQFGTISGRVFDEKKEPMINAGVQVFLNGVVVGGNVTDYDGKYVITNLEPGEYFVVVRYAGYDSVKRKIMVNNNNVTVDVAFKKSDVRIMGDMTITTYFYPFFDIDNPTTRTLTREQISHIPH